MGANSQVPSGSLIWLQTPPSLGSEWMGHQGAGRRPGRSISPPLWGLSELGEFVLLFMCQQRSQIKRGEGNKASGEAEVHMCLGCTCVHRCAQVCTCMQVCIGVGMQLCMCKETERTWGSVKEVQG